MNPDTYFLIAPFGNFPIGLEVYKDKGGQFYKSDCYHFSLPVEMVEKNPQFWIKKHICQELKYNKSMILTMVREYASKAPTTYIREIIDGLEKELAITLKD